MKKLLIVLLGLLLTGCSSTYHLSTLNHDPIYDDENYIVVSDDVKIDTLNEFQFRNKLRTDFNFRLDFAKYAISQPRTFDWNNRILGNRYNWNRNNWGYSYYNYWDRNQMWNDWAWGFTPHRWSPFGYDRWGYNNWMGNAHWGYGYGWNNYYGWNGYNNWYNGPWHNPGYNVAWNSSRNNNNVAYINGRRGSNITNYNNRTNSNIENNITVNRNKPRRNIVVEKDVVSSNLNGIVSELRNSGLKVNIINNNNNDQIIRSNPRSYGRPESGNNGRGSWSRENVPVKPVKPIISTSNQSRQVYRGSGSSSVQQSRGSSTTSRQNGGGTSRQRN